MDPKLSANCRVNMPGVGVLVQQEIGRAWRGGDSAARDTAGTIGISGFVCCSLIVSCACSPSCGRAGLGRLGAV